MFTSEAIKATHAKVRSGADFPQYVKDMKALGVLRYDHYVADGHCVYYGENHFQLSSTAQWAPISVATAPSPKGLIVVLKAHQAGETDYLTFCRQAAENGVEKWTVDMIRMACIYYDVQGGELLKEEIPVM
ncbi:MAG: DUF1398 family protein [Bacteroidetes bacterium]|nr:DUF1398 family protein [Bacteroidota bacterium]